MRQSLDQLATQFVASQQQMAKDIARLKSAELDILAKISAEQEILAKISAAPSPRPPAAEASKPTSVVPLRSSQELQVR
jgi:hypothetical protein